MRIVVLLTVALASTGVFADNSAVAKMVTAGKGVYSQTCIACHGANGKGAIPGVPSFTSSDGPLSKTDAVLQKHISEGFQSPGSPMAMPAKGGNPSLDESDIEAVLTFIRAEFGT